MDWRSGQSGIAADTHAPILIYPNPLNPKQLRGAEQRLHLPRVRLSEQRAPDSEAAGLGGCGYDERRPMTGCRARS